MTFYTYLWLREDGTPYYVGKGHGRRGLESTMHRFHRPKELDRIVILPCSSEEEAFVWEILLIWAWGRKDKETGCLRNLTDGGEGASGCARSSHFRQRQRERMLGNKIGSRNKGRTISTEQREKIRASLQGRAMPVERRLKISAALKGRKRPTFTAETRLKMSQARLGREPWNKGKRRVDQFNQILKKLNKEN